MCVGVGHDEDDSNATATIAGITVGIIILLIVVASVVACAKKHKRTRPAVNRNSVHEQRPETSPHGAAKPPYPTAPPAPVAAPPPYNTVYDHEYPTINMAYPPQVSYVPAYPPPQ